MNNFLQSHAEPSIHYYLGVSSVTPGKLTARLQGRTAVEAIVILSQIMPEILQQNSS
jgi:hypothetical protein